MRDGGKTRHSKKVPFFRRVSDVGEGDKRLIFGESNLCKNHLIAGCDWEKPIGTRIIDIDTRGLIQLA